MFSITEHMKEQLMSKISRYETDLYKSIDEKSELEKNLKSCNLKINRAEYLIKLALEEIKEIEQFEKWKSEHKKNE